MSSIPSITIEELASKLNVSVRYLERQLDFSSKPNIRATFKMKLVELIGIYQMDRNIPGYILADYLMNCMDNLNIIVSDIEVHKKDAKSGGI